MPKVRVTLDVVEGAPEGLLPQVVEGRAAFIVCVLEKGEALIPAFLQAADGPDVVLMAACAIRHLYEEYGPEAVADAMMQSKDFGTPITGERVYIPRNRG